MICTFFGHRDAGVSIEEKLTSTLIRLIEVNKVEKFYVGNQGDFDRLVLNVLCKLKVKYPQIETTVVLAYMPTHSDILSRENNWSVMLPEGIETVPKRFAILWRNRWLVERADYVVTYVVRSGGGAAQFKSLAQKKYKTVIEISHQRQTDQRYEHKQSDLD